MRGFVDGLRAVHANVARANPKPGQQYNERIKRRPLASEHPLVTVHAETGERVLEDRGAKRITAPFPLGAEGTTAWLKAAAQFEEMQYLKSNSRLK